MDRLTMLRTQASTLVSTAAIVAAIAAYRLYECTLLPLETGDIARNVLYGAATLRDGFAAASHPLTDYSSAWEGVSWSRFPYSYPPVAQAFFNFVRDQRKQIGALAEQFSGVGNSL